MSLVVLRYTLLRLALFVAVFAVLALAGARGALLLGLTVVISLALSYLLLRGQRDAVAAVIAERVGERATGPGPARQPAAGSDEAVEDAEDDARRSREARRTAALPGPEGPGGPGTQDRIEVQDDSVPNASPRPSSTP